MKHKAVVGNGPFEVKDVARVQAIAQLGARVLEIIKERAEAPALHARLGFPGGPATLDDLDASAWACVQDAARSLGLLDENGGQA